MATNFFEREEVGAMNGAKGNEYLRGKRRESRGDQKKRFFRDHLWISWRF
jgi:hypothetical protein